MLLQGVHSVLLRLKFCECTLHTGMSDQLLQCFRCALVNDRASMCE